MTTSALPKIFSYEYELDLSEKAFGFLRDSSDLADDFEALRQRMDEEGYLYMKGYLDADQVLGCRKSLTDRMEREGMLDPNFPSVDAIIKPGTTSAFNADLARHNEDLNRLLYSGKLIDFYLGLFGQDIRHFDYTWLRVMGPGKGTNPHCDFPYMNRGSKDLLTCWLPYGEVSFELGGLMILENSHKKADLLKNYLSRDVDTYCENRNSEVQEAMEGKWSWGGHLSKNPYSLREKLGGRWLTTEYAPGDFLTFKMSTVHASLDNRTANRIRISSDTRYQPAADPIDERWIGENPIGHTVAGKRGRIC